GKKDLKDVQYLLRHGTAFGTVIAHLKVVSVHGCKVVQCGDLGWVPYDFVPPNRRMLETAHNYAIVGPLAGQGYWDFYLVEAHNPKYVLSARQLYTRRTLLFQKWLQRQEHRANVKRYVAA
ncbi:MAG: hypothetical protein ACRDFX_14475, partial [Chloroflexota bacterium]